MRELAAAIVVPAAPPIAARGRVPLWPALAPVAVLLIILAIVPQLATRNGETLGPSSPAPVPTATPLSTPLVTPSPCPSVSPTPSHRATPNPRLPSSTLLPTACVTHTITGTITELGPQGQQPVAGARIDVFLYSSRRGGHWMSDVTEADGRYELWGIPSGAVAVLYAGKDNGGYVGYVGLNPPGPEFVRVYLQPCGHEVTVKSDTSLDIEIVPTSAGGAAASAAARRGPGPFLTGVVYGQLPDGTRAPLPNAMVLLDGDSDPLAAATITDADGRYVICGVSRGVHYVAATSEGYARNDKNPDRRIDVTGDMTLDLELKR